MIPKDLKLPDTPRKQMCDLVDKMNETIGLKDPIEYFKLLTEAIEMLIDQNIVLQETVVETTKDLLNLKVELHRVKTQTALAIQWEPKVAASMLGKQIDILRQDKDTYFNEIDALKKAYTEDRVTQNYHDFCKFWTETLGWHPFLDE